MNFILKMAWRDSRTSRRKLALFSLSIVLGVAALVAIGSFAANLRRAVDDQSKGLLGADLAVKARATPSAEARAFIDSIGGERSREVAFSSMAAFPSAGGRARLVTVRAIEGGYPYYGEVRTSPAGAYARLAGGDAALVEETLMRQFGLSPGDPIRLGEKTFAVAGALEQFPGDSPAAATLSPRVLVSLPALEGSGLLGRGALARHAAYFKFPAGFDAERFAAENKDRLAGLRLTADTVEERRRELGRTLQNVQGFLSLTGFVALVLGAIGVGSAMHAYASQKVATVAVLRCLGAGARQAFSVYLIQGLALGLAGAAAGAILGVAAQAALPALAKGVLPFEVEFFVSWAAVGRGLAAGVLVGGLFTLLPLLAVRRVPPLAALRSAFAERAVGDPWRWAVYGAIAVAVTAFAAWQTGRWSWGLGFAGALAACFGVLAAAARGVSWAARRFVPKKLPYVWRQGAANLHRPNNRTVLLLLSLGLGAFLLTTLSLARETLLAQIRGAGEGARPNLLFFDIQDDQLAPLRELLGREGAPVLASAPVVTMRLSRLKGRPVEEWLKDDASGIPAWTLRREYRSTFRATTTDTETVTVGVFSGFAGPAGEAVPVSIEEGLAKDMRLGLGDEIEFDVQGVPVAARVGSIRRVEWRRMSPNFFVVFPQGVLEAAPKFHVLAAKAAGAADSARVQQAAVAAFPNVSALDLSLVLQTLDGIFSKVQFVVRFMSFFTVATGAIVLAGAVAAGRFQRVRETVLLRTLGASRRQIARIQLAEYATLGALGSLTGGALAYAANAALALWVFKAPAIFPPGPLAVAMLGCTTLTVATGWIVSRGIAGQPPLEVLRQEG